VLEFWIFWPTLRVAGGGYIRSSLRSLCPQSSRVLCCAGNQQRSSHVLLLTHAVETAAYIQPAPM